MKNKEIVVQKGNKIYSLQFLFEIQTEKQLIETLKKYDVCLLKEKEE